MLQKLIDESLSEKQRLAIRGTLQGLPVEEIAYRLNSNRNAVYKLVHDARLRLRKEFEACGITSEDIATVIS
jgi:RNA polymerase sigma-70 factor (ECF subfamily)